MQTAEKCFRIIRRCGKTKQRYNERNKTLMLNRCIKLAKPNKTVTSTYFYCYYINLTLTSAKEVYLFWPYSYVWCFISSVCFDCEALYGREML